MLSPFSFQHFFQVCTATSVAFVAFVAFITFSFLSFSPLDRFFHLSSKVFNATFVIITTLSLCRFSVFFSLILRFLSLLFLLSRLHLSVAAVAFITFANFVRYVRFCSRCLVPFVIFVCQLTPPPFNLFFFFTLVAFVTL